MNLIRQTGERIRIESLEGRVLLHGDASPGLLAEYFSDPNLTRSALVRVDPQINVDWGRTAPIAQVGKDDFSVRWAGKVTVPATGRYSFYASTDDGVRLWIDGRLLINQWAAKSHQVEFQASIDLTAGEHHDIRMDYFERGGQAYARLAWSGPGLAKQIVPTSAFEATLDAPQTPTPPVVSTGEALRINAGGGRYVDSAGASWEADAGFTGGTMSTSPFGVGTTDNDPLYYTRRWGNFDFAAKVADGDYTLKLLFTDPIFNRAGQRMFDVFAEDRQILNDFDIAAKAGGKQATSATFNVGVTDGQLDVAFRSVVDNAIISAIEITPRTAPPAQNPWTDGAPALGALFEAQGALGANGRMYVFGGFYNAEVQATRMAQSYDPKANAWSRIADMPVALTHAGVVADGDSIWMVGGLLGDYPDNLSTADVWRYSISRNTWTRGPSLPSARAAGGLVLLGRQLHFIGGLGSDGQSDVSTHFWLDIDSGKTWNTAAPLPIPRNHLGAAVVAGKIYIIGGQHGRDETTQNLRDVHRYDPATNSWTAVASLPFVRSHFGASTVVTPTGKILIIGGVTNGRAPLTNVTQYDPAANRWTDIFAIPQARKAPVAFVDAGKLYVTTGSLGDHDPRRDMWIRSL